jgi:hypothetical protein
MQLGDREVAQVADHRRGLGDGFGDALAVGGIKRSGVLDEHGADDLAGDEQGSAGAVRRLAAELAAQQRAVGGVALVRAPEPRGDARARLDAVGERPCNVRVLGQRRRGLEPVGAVVAVENDHGRFGSVRSR